MRIVFIGSPPFAMLAFAALLARAEPPVGLVTVAERGAGRGRRPRPNPLAECAAAGGLTVLRPQSARDDAFLREFAALQPDLGVVVSYGQILSTEFLDTPVHGCVNVHGSLLPRWRGASPVQAALLAGDARTGVTLQRVVPELDAGPVLASRELPIGARETAPELTERLAQAGAELLRGYLDALGDGALPAGEPQDASRKTTCRRIRREEGRIDWRCSADEVDRRVRAMAGWPVAETRLPDGAPLKVLSGMPLEDEEGMAAGAGGTGAEPGTLLDPAGGIVVRCGTGAYRIDRLQRAGRQALDAAEFLRGAALQAGERLRPFEEARA